MQLRPARPKDLKVCATLDHSYSTDHVWQMEVRQEGGAVASVFREASLPRERAGLADRLRGLLSARPSMPAILSGRRGEQSDQEEE